jgi:hypothetical protein
MKKDARIRYTIFAVIFIAVLVVSSVFASDALAGTKSIIRITAINNSQFPFKIYLYGGGEEYTLKVPPRDSDKIFIKPGVYSYYMEVCNYSHSGTMNLSVFRTLHIPVCGGRASQKDSKFHHIDISRIVKPVKVKVRNKTGDEIGVYLRTQEDHQFLNLASGEVIEVFLKKQEDIQYVYSLLGCGGQLVSGYYTPLHRWPLDLKCPKSK